MPEVLQPVDRPTALIAKTLGDAKALYSLLSVKGDEKENMLDAISHELTSFDDVETTSLVKFLIRGLAKDDEEWNVDKRDGALEILGIADLAKVNRDTLLQEYQTAVLQQHKDSDPLGSISSLLEAGKVIGPSLPFGEDAIEDVKLVWDNVAQQFTGEDKNFIDKGKEKVLNSLIADPEELLGNTEVELGRREQPKLDKAEKALHDHYLETVKQQKTFKLTLWKSVPKFRMRTLTYGLPLERFWNLHDPDDIADALIKLRSDQPSSVRDVFHRALRERTGLGLDEITPEQARIVADEVILSARDTQSLIKNSLTNFATITNRFRQIVAEASNRPARAQKAIVRPIINFFRENSVEIAKPTIEGINEFLADEKVMEKAEATFNLKQQTKQDAIQVFEDAFSLSNNPTNYSLMSRTREDMFLGDLTGDCTSYHLVVGMNAWTVPIWLTNPGFNFFKITDGDQLVAKLGIILGVADGQPALIVDSFEIGQKMKDKEISVDLIEKGLRFLRQWAEKVDLEVYINNISNSSGAMDLLNGTCAPSKKDDIFVMGGLSGVAELSKELIAIKPKNAFISNLVQQHSVMI